MDGLLKLRMRWLNNELQYCDKQSTSIAYFEAGMLSLLFCFSALVFTSLTVKFNEIEEAIQEKVMSGLICVYIFCFVFRASTVEIEANLRSPLLDSNTDNQMITAEQNENRSQSNNNAHTNNMEELEAKVSMLEMENYELKAKLRENQHFIRRVTNSQMKQDVQKKYEELSAELYKAYLELQKVRSELAHSKSMQNSEDGHQAENRQTENMDNMVREIDALKASLDRETSRADWYHGEVEYFRRRVQELENEIHRRSSEHAHNDSAFRECERLQAQLHDMTNKAKWYEGEKEYFKREMENYSSRCAELDKYNCTIKNIINEALIVRKDPYYDRQKWNLAQVSSNENKQFRHVIFKYACATAHQVYLTASFYNWECAILMNKQDDGIWSIGIDVPLGRHEFRFLQLQNCDCSSHHPTCYNDYGSLNNWIMVE
ncbi:hypothetical protein T4B_11332 [Trichinella pseudospiralis]|uniref:AMP-activated protein kinase glycogen-binding domain-containing protein n=1 Tax=Trichinella pseudospiralis TaxID=6337 RepID=A0A0V1I828_TRIPS|nr:hypothetical protein T4B_11332 [Trichinella pseudospiralis]